MWNVLSFTMFVFFWSLDSDSHSAFRPSSFTPIRSPHDCGISTQSGWYVDQGWCGHCKWVSLQCCHDLDYHLCIPVYTTLTRLMVWVVRVEVEHRLELCWDCCGDWFCVDPLCPGSRLEFNAIQTTRLLGICIVCLYVQVQAQRGLLERSHCPDQIVCNDRSQWLCCWEKSFHNTDLN